MDLRALKEHSEQLLGSRGFPTNISLPALEPALLQRGAREIQDRALALHCTVALACGVDAARVRAQLAKEDLVGHLSPREEQFVRAGDMTQAMTFRTQEEALLALVWALGLAVHLDPFAYCDESLGRALPNGALGRSAAQFRLQGSLRPQAELVTLLDLLYRMDWGFVAYPMEAGRASGIQWYVVRERRRALEWVLGSEPWDHVSLDT